MCFDPTRMLQEGNMVGMTVSHHAVTIMKYLWFLTSLSLSLMELWLLSMGTYYMSDVATFIFILYAREEQSSCSNTCV